MSKEVKVAIVGGGVAGVTTALWLGELGINVTLFEKEKSLVFGPPFCHLHAGGNLYREISDEQCIKLLKQSIDFLKFYPFVVDYRPTLIALPIYDKQEPNELLRRLKLLQSSYANLIKEDKSNEVLGESENYYQLYSKEKMLELKELPLVAKPSSSDEWMRAVAKELDFNKVKFPLILVQEYGLNLFWLAAGASLALEQLKSVDLKLNSEVTKIKQHQNSFTLTSFNIEEKKEQEEQFDYLINAAGFRTGKIDDMLQIPCERMVEFKAAYVTHWQSAKREIFPEIIFHGERGTPQGMGQFTPYPAGHFQLHGMTHNITLYEDGLVSNTPISCQPKLGKAFLEKIEKSWNKEEVKKRTQAAIEHIAEFIPNFSEATVASKPLFGAQQIPGDDPTLRVAEVSFPIKRYARCEIVKVSSTIDMASAIADNIASSVEFFSLPSYKRAHSSTLQKLNKEEIQKFANKLAIQREYPLALSFKIN